MPEIVCDATDISAEARTGKEMRVSVVIDSAEAYIVFDHIVPAQRTPGRTTKED